MRGHSRPKDGVLSHAYDPRIHDEARMQNSCGSDRLRRLMDCRSEGGMSSPSVIAGLVPAIPLRRAKQCDMNRDGRDKPGHDGASYRSATSLRTSTIRRNPDAARGQALACANPCSHNKK